MARTLARRPASGRMLSASSLLEQLEQRNLLDADFVGIGLRFDNGPQVFFAEGVVADADDSITGTMRFADHTGATSTGPIDWTSLNRGAGGGSFTFGTRNGFTPYASQTGTQFLVLDRWLSGSFAGHDAQGALRDFAVLGEAESGISFDGFFRTTMNMSMLTSSGVENVVVHVTPTPDVEVGTSFRFTYMLSSGTIVDDKAVVSNEDSRIEFDSGELLVFPHSALGHNAAWLVDMNADDDIVGMAVGAINTVSVSQQQANDAGRFRSTVLVDGPIGAAFFGVDPNSVTPGAPRAVSVIIELHLWSVNSSEGALPNTFRVYRQSEWDLGQRTPITQGTFQYVEIDDVPEGAARSVIRLESDGGLTLDLQSVTGRGLTFEAVSDANGRELIQGFASAIIYRNGNPAEYLAHVDANGRPIVYMELGNEGNEQMLSIDLIDEVGGEIVVGSLVTWSSGDFFFGDRYVAGLNADGDILLWRGGVLGIAWSFVNLTEAMAGARPIASELFNAGVTTSANPVYAGEIPPTVWYQTLAGYDSDGNFVAYRWALDSDQGRSTWEFDDVEVDGVGSAGVVPDAVGGFTGWTSGWGASHFAGIDSSGELWVVWWAPGMEQWSVDNLSDNAGTPTLSAARPSFTQTTWDTFHIFATDLQGHVSVTWWAVGFNTWAHDDLTDLLSGPTLQTGTLTAGFATPLHNLNVVGLDQNGDVRIYWWNVSTGWQVNTIAPASADIPQTPWLLTWSWYTDTSDGIGEVDTQTLLGRNDDGDLVRLVWRSDGLDEWLFENVTEMSVPYGLM